MSREKDWEVENAADTLLRAEEVKNKPELHKKALVVLKKRQTALAEVEGMGDGAIIRAKRRKQAKPESHLLPKR